MSYVVVLAIALKEPRNWFSMKSPEGTTGQAFSGSSPVAGEARASAYQVVQEETA